MTDCSSAWPARETLGRLVREAQRDGTDALNRLLAGLPLALVTFFERRLLPDLRSDIEDLAQAALMRIAKALRRIDPERAEITSPRLPKIFSAPRIASGLAI